MNEKCQAEIDSLESLRKLYPEFAVNSRYYPSYTSPMFKSAELGNYQLLSNAPGYDAGTQLPSEVRKIIGQSKKESQFVGAFPPLP